MRMLMVGAPGAGKGSQAARVSASLGIPAISTGDIFRANVRDRTELGIRVQEILRAGDYVPDSITNAMVRDRLSAADVVAGFILDGYPRTADQAAELDELLASQGVELDVVLHLVVPVEQLVPRLLHRAQQDGRDDDTAEAIRHRLDVYESVTAPIVSLYAERGLVRVIDGVGRQDDVADRIALALEARAA
jgi:adenylate kinase